LRISSQVKMDFFIFTICLTSGLLLGGLFFRFIVHRFKLNTPSWAGWILRSKMRLLYREPGLTLAPLELKAGQKILEIGPGEGIFTSKISSIIESSGKVVSVEIKQYFYEKTLDIIKKEKLGNVDLILGDASNLSQSDNTFDAIILIAVLPMIKKQEEALSEIKRVLKPSGKLLISEDTFEPEYVLAKTTRKICQRAGFSLIYIKKRLFSYTCIFEHN